MTVHMTTWQAGDKLVRVLLTPGGLLVFIEGYGVKGVPHGAPIYISLVGHPIILVWANIKKDGPTHSISLLYAREEKL